MSRNSMKTAGSKILAFILIVVCVTGLYSNSFGESNKSDFYDIKGHWSQKALELLIAKGILQGSPVNGILEVMPDKTISRVEFVAIVVRAFKLQPINANIKTFKDDKKGAWYNDMLKSATSNSLIAGYPDGCFHPNNPVTNEQVSIILTRLRNQQLKSSGQTANASWYATNVLTNVKGEFKSVPAASFIPKNNATRAETLTALYSFMNIIERASAQTPGQSTGGTGTVVGNSGSGNDPVSITPTATSGTGSSGNTGNVTPLPEPAKTGILGYDITAAKGELVYFQVYAYALNELGGFDFKISYDPKVVVATSVRSGSLKEGEYIKTGEVDLSQAASGTLLVKNQDTSAIKRSDGILFTVVFRVQPEAAGSSTIAMQSSGGGAPVLYTTGGSAISPVTCSEGKIIVK